MDEACVTEPIEPDPGKEGIDDIEFEDGGRVGKVVGGVADIPSAESDFNCCSRRLSSAWFRLGGEF